MKKKPLRPVLTYWKQQLHPSTNATCTSITCYARAWVIVLMKGAALDGFFCVACASAKIEAQQMVDLIEAYRASDAGAA